MRLTWLDNLAKQHLDRKMYALKHPPFTSHAIFFRWDEAAQAHLLSAHLIAQYHASLSPKNPPLPPSSFQIVCPNSESEKSLGDTEYNQFQVCFVSSYLFFIVSKLFSLQDSTWSIKVLVSHLDSAFNFFANAGHLELAYETLCVCEKGRKGFIK